MPFRTIARLNPAKPKAGEEFRLQVVAQHPNEPGTRGNRRVMCRRNRALRPQVGSGAVV